MSRLSRKLTVKITAGIIAVGLTLYLVVAGLLFLQSRYMIRKEAHERAASVLTTAMQQVRNHMNLVETAANANMWLADECFEPDSLVSLAHDIVRHNHHTYGCAIAVEPGLLSHNGHYFSVQARMEGDSVVLERESDYDHFKDAWYNMPMTSGRGSWVVASDSMLAVYSRPFSKQGIPVGVVATSMSFRKMAELIYSVDYPYPNVSFVILGSDGHYLLTPDEAALPEKTGWHYRIERPVEGTDWRLVMICPASEVLANYYKMAVLVVIFDILALLLIALLAWWGVRRALAPIGGLVAISDQVATGHYECVVPKTQREDAVGRMQNSFVAMQHSIMDNVGRIKRKTERSIRHNQKLVRAMQMEKEALKRKNVFLQNVMHQMRTPLNIILGFGQVLQDEKLKTAGEMGDEELKGITTMMKHNAVHLNRMVMMLYDSSDTGTTEEQKLCREDHVSCNAVVRECIDFTKEHFPDMPIEFTTELPNSTMILTNHLFLMRTIRELIYNAAKYSDGTSIGVIVTETDTTVLFVIEDKGPGLPANMDYEFFTKQDDLSEGLGLGLPLSKRHAQSLGGDMLYDDTYHEGCRFVITIPK